MPEEHKELPTLLGQTNLVQVILSPKAGRWSNQLCSEEPMKVNDFKFAVPAETVPHTTFSIQSFIEASEITSEEVSSQRQMKVNGSKSAVPAKMASQTITRKSSSCSQGRAVPTKMASQTTTRKSRTCSQGPMKVNDSKRAVAAKIAFQAIPRTSRTCSPRKSRRRKSRTSPRKSRTHSQGPMKVNDLKRAVAAKIASQMITRTSRTRSQGQMKVNDSKHALRAEIATQPTARKTRAFRVLGNNKKVEDHFILGEKTIEGGSDSTVVFLNAKKKNVEEGDIQDCVVKVQMKKRSKKEESWRKVMTHLLASQVCPHVLKTYEIFEDNKAFYTVMEKCSGGELFDFLLNETEIALPECKRIVREILVALNDLHSKGLIHGDVKPENLMFSDKANMVVKLIDFDLCQVWNPTAAEAQRIVGTPGYIAPEVLLGEASLQSDLWSVGVILHLLMTGKMPWGNERIQVEDAVLDGSNPKAAYQYLRKHHSVNWNRSNWSEFPSAANLCQQLLAFDPRDRTQSATEALNHPWLQQTLLK